MLDTSNAIGKLTGKNCAPTYGNSARKLIDWLREVGGLRVPYDRAEQQTIRNLITPYTYHRALPGRHGDCTLYDLKGAFWSCLKRQPSLLASDKNQRLRWEPMPDKLSAAWREVETLVDTLPKRFRLCLIGVSLSGVRGQGVKAWHDGGACEVPCGAFNFMSLAAAISVRTTYELTQIQAAESYSKYANTDCVIVNKKHGTPKFWDRCGMEYGVKGEGETTVRAVGSYEIGETSTLIYQKCSTNYRLPRFGNNVDTNLHNYLLAGA